MPGTSEVDLLAFPRARDPLRAGPPAEFAVDAARAIGRAEARPNPRCTRLPPGPGGAIVLPSAGGVVVPAVVRFVAACRPLGGGVREAQRDHGSGARRNGVANHSDRPGGVRAHAAHRGGGGHQRSRLRKSQVSGVVRCGAGHVGDRVSGRLFGDSSRAVERRDQQCVRHVGERRSACDRRRPG